MLKTAAGITGFVLSLFGAMFLVPGVVLTYLWQTTDEPTRSFACRSRGGGSATCYEGEGAFMVLGLGFGGLALGMLVAGLLLLRKAARDAANRRRLLERGLRAPGTVVAVTATNTHINGRRQYQHHIEFHGPSGPIMTRHRSHPIAREGSRVEVAYDPADPGNAVLARVIEDPAIARMQRGADVPELVAAAKAGLGLGTAGVDLGTAGLDLGALSELQQRFMRGEITADQLQAETMRLMSGRGAAPA